MVEGKATLFWALIVAFAELLPPKSVTCTLVDLNTIVDGKRKSDTSLGPNFGLCRTFAT